ncbi:hypothetical protein [Xanthomonas phaseoli]|uniref:hypothetical protein n=1 Tax=Xanthomonas phaseoli TaxID=1985254 RepID=UPI0012375A52|nr:hypothetical protein [Xanthomonas phaseoli]
MNAVAIGSALHPSLRDDWTRPAIPEGFDRLVYCEYGFAGELDFLNDAADVFASEEQGHLALPSPWVDGFVPALRDWQALDILFIDLRPR